MYNELLSPTVCESKMRILNMSVKEQHKLSLPTPSVLFVFFQADC